MTEFCFVVACTAGIVEGASVLNHANKKQEATRRRSTPLLLVPSLFYGTVALPMGMIGASPGPSLVSLFPFAPAVLAESGSSDSAASTPFPSTSNGNKLHDVEDITMSLEQENHQDHPIMSWHDMIRKMREDNKRALAAMKNQPVVEQSQPKLILQKQKRASRKLLSTLDGRPLATPLAEAMRRARFLFVGAGLVMSLLSYEQSRQAEQERERALQLEKRQRGRDVNAIETLIKEGGFKNGAVVRLMMGRNYSLHDLAKSKGVLPLVYAPVDFSSLKASLYTATGNSEIPYWNLGTTPQEWKQTPLTKDWLFRTDDNGQGCLVLEADLSCTLLSDYLSQQESPTTEAIANVMWVSKILDMIARQKGVVVSPPDGDDDKHANVVAAPVNVLIACGERPPQIFDSINTIYMNGPLSVSAEVLSILERMHSEPSAEEFEEMSVEEAVEGDQELPATALISALDYVGMKLRQGGTFVAAAVSGVLSRREDKRVYVLSDDTFAPLWIRRIMPYEWTVLAYNALNDVESFRNSITENGVTFVCCQTDEATSATVCSLSMLEEGGAKRLVALVQEESCASSLRDLVKDLNKGTHVKIVSVKGIHASLFDHARELLESGKTPAEVQKLIADAMQ